MAEKDLGVQEVRLRMRGSFLAAVLTIETMLGFSPERLERSREARILKIINGELAKIIESRRILIK